MRKGTLAALGAYLLWGIMPIYWKLLQNVPAIEILAHRIVWSLVFVALLLAARKHWGWLKDIAARPGAYRRFLVTSVLLAINYGTYLWANNNGHIVESSLGYFINPLVNVLLGMIFLAERPRPGQWLAIGIATIGVSYLTFTIGRLPWIALTLAFSFGIYGLLRKTAKLGSIEGLTVEMGLLSVPSLILLTILAGRGGGHFVGDGPATTLLLIGAGAATAIPMLLFTYGARRVTMTTLGILQYVAPTMQFLIGVFLYHEPFDQSRLAGFVLIWTALAIYWVESFVRYRSTRLAAAQNGRPSGKA
jgi:chloramphenicol-sensitive protein RarD